MTTPNSFPGGWRYYPWLDTPDFIPKRKVTLAQSNWSRGTCRKWELKTNASLNAPDIVKLETVMLVGKTDTASINQEIHWKVLHKLSNGRRRWRWTEAGFELSRVIDDVQGLTAAPYRCCSSVFMITACRAYSKSEPPPLFPISLLVILSLKGFWNSNDIIFVRSSSQWQCNFRDTNASNMRFGR